MIDGIIAGTGDSRSLYGSLPSTYAEFKAAVQAGTQYVDVSYNAAGWQQEPTFLNKANLLTDAVAALLGLTPNATVNDAFNAASGLISTAQTTANGRARMQTGSYTGTGTYGSSNPNSLSLNFPPKLIIVQEYVSSPNQASNQTYTAIMMYRGSNSDFGGLAINYGNVYPLKGTRSGNTVTWYTNTGATQQMNKSGASYDYAAIG